MKVYRSKKPKAISPPIPIFKGSEILPDEGEGRLKPNRGRGGVFTPSQEVRPITLRTSMLVVEIRNPTNDQVQQVIREERWSDVL